MRQAKDSLGVTVGVGGMDIAFNDIVAHEAVDHIGAFAIRLADHQGMSQEITLIDEGIAADALSLPEAPERPAGVQTIPLASGLPVDAECMKTHLASACSYRDQPGMRGPDNVLFGQWSCGLGNSHGRISLLSSPSALVCSRGAGSWKLPFQYARKIGVAVSNCRNMETGRLYLF